MEIQTPLTIWNNYDKSGSINERIISVTDCGEYEIYRVYFDGEVARDGVTRIYAHLYRPKKVRPLPAVLFFDDEHESLGDDHIKVLLDEGFIVLWVDYTGHGEGESRYTLYPDSLLPKKGEFELIENLKESRLYIYGCVGFKALNYILSKDFVQKDNIGVLGVGNAGSIVWSLSIKEKLKAGMTVYGGGFLEDWHEKDPLYLVYKAALDVRSYSQYSLFPILIQGASNEPDNSLDYQNELYDCTGNNYFSIAPRATRAIVPAQKKNLKYWFAYQLNGTGYLPNPPEITARESDGRLYYDLEVDGKNEIAFVSLFTSEGDEDAAFRNWSEKKIEKVSPGKYIAKVSVCNANEPMRAFVAVKYRHSLYLASPVLLKIPKQMKIVSEPQKSRLIYDSDMGLDDFVVPNDYDLKYDSEKLIMRNGPFDIRGVCSMTGQIATFKLGDYKYKGQGDSLLKILLHVEDACSVTFSVTSKNKDTFECVKDFTPEEGWAQVSLAPFDFKSQKYVLSDWNDIVSIKITVENTKLLLSSMLWV